jgi:hypothetical protein
MTVPAGQAVTQANEEARDENPTHEDNVPFVLERPISTSHLGNSFLGITYRIEQFIIKILVVR